MNLSTCLSMYWLFLSLSLSLFLPPSLSRLYPLVCLRKSEKFCSSAHPSLFIRIWMLIFYISVHCGIDQWVWPIFLKTLTLLIIFNSECYNFHIAECQHLLWQNLCTGIVEIFVLVTRSSLEWLLWGFGGGGCISQNSTHLVGFLSFFLYFSYECI